MVTVNDGELVNQPPAFTTVQVNIMNEAPRVLLDDEQVIGKFLGFDKINFKLFFSLSPSLLMW